MGGLRCSNAHLLCSIAHLGGKRRFWGKNFGGSIKTLGHDRAKQNDLKSPCQNYQAFFERIVEGDSPNVSLKARAKAETLPYPT
jgi:hypothetical protein